MKISEIIVRVPPHLGQRRLIHYLQYNEDKDLNEITLDTMRSFLMTNGIGRKSILAFLATVKVLNLIPIHDDDLGWPTIWKEEIIDVISEFDRTSQTKN